MHLGEWREVSASIDEILLEAPIEATDEVALILKDTIEEAGKVPYH
jgi:hypothetical protein